MANRRYNIKLDVASPDYVQIVPIGQTLSEVIVASVPAGVSFALVFGDGDPYTIDKPQTFKPTGDDAERGLFYQNVAAQVGVSVDIQVCSAAAGAQAGTLGVRLGA